MTAFDISLKMYLWAMAAGLVTAVLVVIISDTIVRIREGSSELSHIRAYPWKLHYRAYMISSLAYFALLIKYNL